MQNNISSPDSQIFADSPLDAYSYAKSRVKPDKGRRRKHEDLYPLHFRANDGEHTMFTGDLRKDLEIFSALVTSSGYRPGQELLTPEVLMSAVIERFVNGGGMYSYNAIFRDLDTVNAKADLGVVIQIVLKRINNYIPSPKGRKVRKYIFQLYVKNYVSPFTNVPKVTHKWRSDMFNNLLNDAVSSLDTKVASLKASEVINNIDTAPLVQKLTDNLTTMLPKTASAAGHSAGRGVVEGVMSKFTDTFQSAMSTVTSTLTSLPKWVAPLIKAIAALSVLSLVGFFGYKLVTYCFPSIFGSVPTYTSDGFGDTLSSFADWIASGFDEIKSSTPFSSSTIFSKMKDSIVIMTFFEKFTNAITGVSKLFTAIVNWLCTKITGKPFFDDAVKLKALFDECNRLINYLEGTSSYVPLAEQEKYIEQYALCSSLADGIFKLDPALYSRMHTVLATKLPIFEKFSRAVKSGTMRQEPVLVWFTGGAGTYKSNTVDHLYQVVFRMLSDRHPDAFKDIGEPAWHSGLVGVRSIEDKFWSNYAENWAFTMDDVFQTTSQTAIESEANIIFMAKQRSRFPLTSAGVSDKGTLFFKSKIIACTSNYSESLFSQVGCPGMYFAPAFQRRRDYIVELSVNPNIPPGVINTPTMWDNIVFSVRSWSHVKHAHQFLFQDTGLSGLMRLGNVVTERYYSYYKAHLSASTFSAADFIPPSNPPPTRSGPPTPPASPNISGNNSPRSSIDDSDNERVIPTDTRSTFLTTTSTTTDYLPPGDLSDDSFSDYEPPSHEVIPVANINDDLASKTPPGPEAPSFDKAASGASLFLNLRARLSKIGKKLSVNNLERLQKDGRYTSEMYGWFKLQVGKLAPLLPIIYPYQVIPRSPFIHIPCYGFTPPKVPTSSNMTPVCDALGSVMFKQLMDWLHKINHPYFENFPTDLKVGFAHLFETALQGRDPSLISTYSDNSTVQHFKKHYVGFANIVKYGTYSNLINPNMAEFFLDYYACLPLDLIKFLSLQLGHDHPSQPRFTEIVEPRVESQVLITPDYSVADYISSILFYSVSATMICAIVGGAIRLIIDGLKYVGALSASQLAYFSDSGDTQLEKSQMDVVNHLRKARPKRLNDLITGDHTSDHSASHTGAYNRIMSNLYLVDFNKISSGSIDSSPNWIWFMSANIAVVPTHYLARAPYTSITIYPGYKSSNVDNEIVAWKDIVRLETINPSLAADLAKRDLTALYIPGLRFARKDSWNQLPSLASLKNFENYQGIRRLGFDLSGETLSLQYVENTSSPILYGLSQAKYPFKTDLVSVDDYFELKGMEGGPGLCMSPYVPASSSVPIVICGFHIASYSRANTVQFAPFTREDHAAITATFQPLIKDNVTYKPPPGDEFYRSDCAPLVFSDTLDEAVGLRVCHSIDRTVSSSNRSNIIKTVVGTGTTHLPPPYPDTSAPASLSKRAQQLSWRKLDGRKHYYDSSVFSDPRVFDGSFPKFLRKEYCCRFLDLSQCVEGVPGTHIHSTDIQKASGAPFNTYSIKKSDLIIRNAPSSNIFVPPWYFNLSLPSSVPSLSDFTESGKPGLWVHPDLQRWFYWWHHWSRQGYTPLALFSFFLKDELRPMSRVLAEYTRYVNAGELAHTLFCKSVTAYYIDQLESDLSVSMQLGINPFSNDWARLYKRIRTRMDPKNPTAVLHDVSAWDICYQVNYMTKWPPRFRSFFNLCTPADLIFYNCIVSVFVSTLLPAVIWGKLVIIRPRMPSGALMTSTFNSFHNDAEHRQIWYWIYPDTPFDSANSIAVFGDDSILGSIFNDEWNGVVIGEIRKAVFSHTCTESTKDEALVPSQPPENWQFLSRGFREEKSLILAPLKIESIRAMCRYIHKPTDKTITAQTALNLRIALNEFGLHGREVFEENLKLLQPFLAELGHEHMYPYTYDELFSLYIELYAGEKCALSHLSFFH
jgi:hypothetical protein